MVRWAETEARFWDVIWESEWREDLEAFSIVNEEKKARTMRLWLIMRTARSPWWERFYGVDLLLQRS